MEGPIRPTRAGAIDKTDEKWGRPVQTNRPVYGLNGVDSNVVGRMQRRSDLQSKWTIRMARLNYATRSKLTCRERERRGPVRRGQLDVSTLPWPSQTVINRKRAYTDLIHPTVLGHGPIVDHGRDTQLWWEGYVTACRRGGRRDDCVCRLTTASVSELVEHANLILSTRSERNGPALQNCELYATQIFESTYIAENIPHGNYERGKVNTVQLVNDRCKRFKVAGSYDV